MSFKFIILPFVLVYLLSIISHVYCAISEYNVMDNGAKCDGKIDDSKVIVDMILFFFKWFFSVKNFSFNMVQLAREDY